MSLKNRLAMAPMTRNRSTPEGVPTPSNATYYAQRSAFGLIVTEGTQPSEDGQGYLLTPGIYTDEQILGWKTLADQVHASGGSIYIQLMHVGRMAHPSNTPHGRQPVAPSAVRPAGKMLTPSGPQNIPEPRALSLGEIAQTIRDFRHAASCAIAAGVDGVQIHAANGYLPHQFLSENANRRTDAYGGSIKNRIRFTIELAAAIADEIGADRTAIHLSPGNTLNDIAEGDTAALYHAMITQLAPLDLAFVSLVHAGDEELLRSIRTALPTALIVNRQNRPKADIAIDVNADMADMASVGRFALANPDLVRRLQTDAKLNEPDPKTFYGGGDRGYTDYPTSNGSTGTHTNGRATTAKTIPADDLSRKLTLVGPKEDAKLQHVALAGDIYTLLLTGDDTANKFCLIDMQIPPGGGPAPHRHDFEETFSVLEGECVVTFRGHAVTVRAGETANVPANAPHFIHNDSDKPAHVLCTCAPAGQDAFFLAVGTPVPNRDSKPPILDAAAKAAIGAKAKSLAAQFVTEFL
jgi:N-ethylmaleimide reductase